MDLMPGLVASFCLLVINKAIIEPIATNLGRDLLEAYVGPCCERLDAVLLSVGIDGDPEMIVRDYLDLEPEELSSKDVEKIVRHVFEVYDIRKIRK